MSAFDQLHPALQYHVVNALGWRELRVVQSEAVDGFLAGANLVVLAPTAGGKTEAAFFPIISEMLTGAWSGLSVLYVSPIRALLNNQEERLGRYFRMVGRRAACWHGDTPAGDKRRIKADPPDCLLTTPESLEVLLTSAKTDHRRFFTGVRAVVIDELHAFAGDDRGWHLLAVLARVGRLAGRDLQRVGLSATVGNPAEMLDWLSSGSARPRRVVRPEPPARVAPEVQLDYVGSLANAAKVIRLLHQGEKRLAFCDSRSRVEQLTALLRQGGTATFVSHSSLGADERRRAEEAFARHRDCVIAATSSLELGLDIGDLDRVVQVDAPPTVSSFLQRMGRTGRRPGAVPNCLLLATGDDNLIRAAALLDLWKEGYVEPVAPPPRPFHILAQQLMALVLQERGVGRSEWFDWVAAVPGFAAMDRRSVSEVVDYIVGGGTLWSDDGILAFAPEGEAKYGRKNFLELLSVFTSPPLFRVVYGREELGAVHESTFYAKDSGPAVIALAGRSWRAKHLDWRKRVAHVEPAEERGRSRWLGSGQFSSRRVCQAVQRLLAGDSGRDWWSRRAAAKMAEVRDEHSWVSEGVTSVVRHPDGEVRWWTFGGGAANRAIVDHLRGTVRTRADNLSIRFPGTATLEQVERWLDELRAEEVTPVADAEALERLKFSECLPSHIASEVFTARSADGRAVEEVLATPRRAVVQQ